MLTPEDLWASIGLEVDRNDSMYSLVTDDWRPDVFKLMEEHERRDSDGSTKQSQRHSPLMASKLEEEATWAMTRRRQLRQRLWQQKNFSRSIDVLETGPMMSEEEESSHKNNNKEEKEGEGQKVDEGRNKDEEEGEEAPCSFQNQRKVNEEEFGGGGGGEGDSRFQGADLQNRKGLNGGARGGTDNKRKKMEGNNRQEVEEEEVEIDLAVSSSPACELVLVEVSQERRKGKKKKGEEEGGGGGASVSGAAVREKREKEEDAVIIIASKKKEEKERAGEKKRLQTKTGAESVRKEGGGGGGRKTSCSGGGNSNSNSETRVISDQEESDKFVSAKYSGVLEVKGPPLLPPWQSQVQVLTGGAKEEGQEIDGKRRRTGKKSSPSSKKGGDVGELVTSSPSPQAGKQESSGCQGDCFESCDHQRAALSVVVTKSAKTTKTTKAASSSPSAPPPQAGISGGDGGGGGGDGEEEHSWASSSTSSVSVSSSNSREGWRRKSKAAVKEGNRSKPSLNEEDEERYLEEEQKQLQQQQQQQLQLQQRHHSVSVAQDSATATPTTIDSLSFDIDRSNPTSSLASPTSATATQQQSHTSQPSMPSLLRVTNVVPGAMEREELRDRLEQRLFPSGALSCRLPRVLTVAQRRRGAGMVKQWSMDETKSWFYAAKRSSSTDRPSAKGSSPADCSPSSSHSDHGDISSRSSMQQPPVTSRIGADRRRKFFQRKNTSSAPASSDSLDNSISHFSTSVSGANPPNSTDTTSSSSSGAVSRALEEAMRASTLFSWDSLMAFDDASSPRPSVVDHMSAPPATLNLPGLQLQGPGELFTSICTVPYSTKAQKIPKVATIR